VGNLGVPEHRDGRVRSSPATTQEDELSVVHGIWRRWGLWLWAGWLLAGLGGREAAADDQGLLFRLGHPGYPVSYLFGTIHSDDPRATDLPPPVLDALDHAELVVTEVVMDAAAAQRSTAALVFADGRELRSLLPPELYAQTVEALAGIGVPESALRHCKPWAVVSLLSVPPPVTGRFLDLIIDERARLHGKPVRGIETVDEQLGIFDTLPTSDQLELLRSTLEQRERLPRIQEQLLQTYLNRDLRGLVEMNRQFMGESDEALARRLVTALIDARNARMVERLVPILSDSAAFVAVGALHLPGSAGMLQWLRVLGFSVTPVF
jgi:uncharacterized protein